MMQYLSLYPPRRQDWNKESIKITKCIAKRGEREKNRCARRTNNSQIGFAIARGRRAEGLRVHRGRRGRTQMGD